MMTDKIRQFKLTHSSEQPWALFSCGSAIKELTEGLPENILFMSRLSDVAGKESEEPGISIEGIRDLMSAEYVLRESIVRRHIENGVYFKDQERAYIDVDVAIGSGTVIYPGVIIEAGTSIGHRCIIGPNSRIVNSEIMDDVSIELSLIHI